MVVKHLTFIWKSFMLNLSKAAQYRISFLLNIVMMIVNDSFFIVQWVIVFSIVPSIGGYGFNDVMLLWAMSAGGYGVAHSLFHGAFKIPNYVYTGKLDVFLTQPKNTLINVACSKSSISAVGDFLYAFVALAIIGAPWWQYPLIVLFSIISGLLLTSVCVIYGNISFYVKNGGALADNVQSTILKASSYPSNLFSGAVKWLLATLIPATFATVIPASILTSWNWGLFALLIAFTSLCVFLAFFTFEKGLKRYGSGNVLSVRD